jgi:hypothetical protein
VARTTPLKREEPLMSRSARKHTTLAVLAICAALMLPASAAAAGGAQIASAGEGPVAHKSGAIVNWVSGFKLRVKRTIQPLANCAVACNVTGTATLKGFGAKVNFSDSGSFQPGQLFGLYITLPKRVVSVMRDSPGRFTLSETLTATDPLTGAVDSISRSFKFKR